MLDSAYVDITHTTAFKRKAGLNYACKQKMCETKTSRQHTLITTST